MCLKWFLGCSRELIRKQIEERYDSRGQLLLKSHTKQILNKTKAILTERWMRCMVWFQIEERYNSQGQLLLKSYSKTIWRSDTKAILTERWTRCMVWFPPAVDHKSGTCCAAEKPCGDDLRFSGANIKFLELMLDFMELTLDFWS